MKITDLIIDPKSIGHKMILVGVQPFYVYENGRRTESIKGYKYEVALADKGYDKIAVKIDGNQQMDVTPEYQEVSFENLEIFVYWLNGNYEVGARAMAIHIAKNKATA